MGHNIRWNSSAEVTELGATIMNGQHALAVNRDPFNAFTGTVTRKPKDGIGLPAIES